MTHFAQICFGIFLQTPSFGHLILPRRDLNSSLSCLGCVRGESNPGSPARPRRLPEPCGEQLPASHDEVLIFPALGTEFIKPLCGPSYRGRDGSSSLSNAGCHTAVSPFRSRSVTSKGHSNPGAAESKK